MIAFSAMYKLSEFSNAKKHKTFNFYLNELADFGDIYHE
jgi:hypothetical protein